MKTGLPDSTPPRSRSLGQNDSGNLMRKTRVLLLWILVCMVGVSGCQTSDFGKPKHDSQYSNSNDPGSGIGAVIVFGAVVIGGCFGL
jgi:hypothetical protein